MEDSFNHTRSTPQTSNPQGAASAIGASNSTDFQETAPQEALSQSAEQLQVQETGQPLSGTATSVVENSSSVLVITGIIALLIVGAWILYKLMKETVEEDLTPSPAAAKKSAGAKKPATTTKKKPAAKSRSKKSTRKKR